ELDAATPQVARDVVAAPLHLAHDLFCDRGAHRVRERIAARRHEPLLPTLARLVEVPRDARPLAELDVLGSHLPDDALHGLLVAGLCDARLAKLTVQPVRKAAHGPELE